MGAALLFKHVDGPLGQNVCIMKGNKIMCYKWCSIVPCNL